ncbi:MAG: hypothetical protein K5877_10505 [Lachnospiraceae bacterium]|nr:hypothetical protein [Lachnospiraceae bacterium]
MTNEQIIFQERLRLLDEGVIKPTGRIIEYEDEDGNLKTMEEPEEIHSFKYWRDKRNRVPRKGSKHIASFPVWTPKKATKEDLDENEDEPEHKKMFLKNTYFFTIDQTDEIK